MPGRMTERDILVLKTHGFTDGQITIAAQVTGYFNYINRVADALGVDPESWMEPGEDEWRARKGHRYLEDVTDD